jgi:DUF3011 family protein
MCKTAVWIMVLDAIILLLSQNSLLAQTSNVICSSTDGQRQHCAADTSAGVVLQRSLGSAECLLGKTWGYDVTGIWVTEGCSGEFAFGYAGGPASTSTPSSTSSTSPDQPIETWGAVQPGKGFLLG